MAAQRRTLSFGQSVALLYIYMIKKIKDRLKWWLVVHTDSVITQSVHAISFLLESERNPRYLFYLSSSVPSHVWLREKEEELRIEKRGPDAVMPPLPTFCNWACSRHHFCWPVCAGSAHHIHCSYLSGNTFLFVKVSDAEVQLEMALSSFLCSIITRSDCHTWRDLIRNSHSLCHAKGSLFEAPPPTGRD